MTITDPRPDGERAAQTPAQTHCYARFPPTFTTLVFLSNLISYFPSRAPLAVETALFSRRNRSRCEYIHHSGFCFYGLQNQSMRREDGKHKHIAAHTFITAVSIEAAATKRKSINSIPECTPRDREDTASRGPSERAEQSGMEWKMNNKNIKTHEYHRSGRLNPGADTKNTLRSEWIGRNWSDVECVLENKL